MVDLVGRSRALRHVVFIYGGRNDAPRLPVTGQSYGSLASLHHLSVEHLFMMETILLPHEQCFALSFP